MSPQAGWWIPELAERRYVKGAFGRYVPDSLVEELVANPELLNLGGELRSMTVLFFDVRNFTIRGEGMTATELMQYVNALLSALSNAIIDHGGTIDKYMGDAVMAFWNAPLEQDDHVARDRRAALGMCAGMDRFNVKNKWTYPETQIGVGINTGGMYVGNLGSKARYDYSVKGMR